MTIDLNAVKARLGFIPRLTLRTSRPALIHLINIDMPALIAEVERLRNRDMPQEVKASLERSIKKLCNCTCGSPGCHCSAHHEFIPVSAALMGSSDIEKVTATAMYLVAPVTDCVCGETGDKEKSNT